MGDKIFIELEVGDKGSVVVKKFVDKTVNKVKQMSDKAGGHVKRLTKKFAVGLGGAVKKVGKALVSLKAFAVTALAGWGITKVLGEFATFESALADMGKVTSESFDSIKKKVMDLPSSLGSATEMVKGYYQVISAGVKGAANQLDTLITASKLAKTAHADQAQVIVGLSSVMDAFKTSSMSAADAIQTMEKTGKTTAGSLIPIIGEISSSSAALGIKLNEMGASFAAVTLQSGGTEKAATQYKALLVSLIAPSKGMIKLLKEYGGAQEAIKQIGFGGVLKLIKDATKGNATATKEMLGSVEAYLGFLSASANNMATYNANLEEQKNKTGAVDKAWKDYMKTLTAIWDTFKNTIGKQVILIGEKLAPAVKKVTGATSAWLEKHREFITLKFEGWINGALEGIARFVEGIAGAVESLYKLITAVHKSISFLAAMGAAVTDVMAAFLPLDPINAFKASIFGLRETFPLLTEMRDNFDAIGVSNAIAAMEAEKSTQKYAKYGETLRGVAVDVRKLITAENAAGNSTKTLSELHDDLVDRLNAGMNKIKNTAKNTASAIDALKPKFKIDPVANDQLDNIKNKAKDTANAIENMKPTFSVTAKPVTLQAGQYGPMKIPKATAAQLKGVIQSAPPVPSAIPGMPSMPITPSFAIEPSSFQSGTGLEGLPHTGLFHGHKGEIVKSPEQSKAERRGKGGNTYNITIAPQFMTGDRAAARSVAAEIRRELDELGTRRN